MGDDEGETGKEDEPEGAAVLVDDEAEEGRGDDTDDVGDRDKVRGRGGRVHLACVLHDVTGHLVEHQHGDVEDHGGEHEDPGGKREEADMHQRGLLVVHVLGLLLDSIFSEDVQHRCYSHCNE